MSIEIALEALMNDSICRRVLIYDEAGFSRVCSAILAIEGFGSDIMDEHHNIPELINRSEVGVFVTSYPFGALLLDEVRKRSIPALCSTITSMSGSLAPCLNRRICIA